MEYILISMLTIIIFTYIVSIVANKLLATPIHMKSLILCACCALFISLILPRMFIGFAGLGTTLGIIITVAMISSYCIAYYYDNAMQQMALKENTGINVVEEVVEFSFSETLQTDQTEEKEEEDTQIAADLATSVPVNDAEQILDMAENVEVITDVVAKEFFYPMKYEEQNDVSRFFKIKDKDQAVVNVDNVLENAVQIAATLPTMAEPVVKKYCYPIKCKDNTLPILFKDMTLQLTPPTPSEEPNLTTTVVEQDADPLSNDELHESTNNASNVLLQEMATEFISEDIPEETFEIPLEILLPDSNDLDILMDFAFAQKEQRNFLQALEAFRRALLLYPDSEVAPFLVVEIGTLLKNLGSYNEAIQIFMEGRLLPGVINNNILEQEFINNIAYLRVVKNILVENALEFMPFNLIPEDAFKKIDAEFCEWRSQS